MPKPSARGPEPAAPARPLRARSLRAGLAVAVIAGILTAGAASASASPAGARGTLVSADHLQTLSAQDTSATLTAAGFDANAVRYGVDAYRLVYRTIDPEGRPTTASGLLVLPRNNVRRLHAVAFDHGTETYKPDAPSSMQPDGFLSSPALTYASAGFAGVAPDYLGFGAGPGPHPYFDVASETTATLDMLRAARSFVSSTGRILDQEVFLTGFSQGASAVMGLARALQAGADPSFRVGAVAAISGAYALQRAELPAMLDGEVNGKSAVVYTTYFLVAWNRLHHLYNSPAQVFQAPYASRVEKLFDGTTPPQVMVQALPDTLDQLLTARGFAMLRRPAGRFLHALRTADSVCTDWTPRVPMRLYMATDDEQAVNANTSDCQSSLASRGASVPVADLGTPDYQGSRHLGSAVAGTAATVRWFTQLT